MFANFPAVKKSLFYLTGLLFVSIGPFYSGLSLAQTPSDNSVSLESFLNEATLNNKEIKEARERLAASKQRIPQASALPNPTAGTAYMGEMLETPLGPQKNIYEFEQMIPFPGKLIEKHRIASAETDAAEAELNKTTRDVIFKVSQAYSTLYGVDATLQTVEETRDIVKKSENIAQNRYASQSGSQRDVAKAQAEVSETLQRIFILRQQRNTLEALLNNLLSRPMGAKIEKLAKPSIPVLSLSVDELLDMAKDSRPELQEASALVKRDEHAKTLAKYEYAPDFSIGYQYIEIGNGTTSGLEDGRDAWMIPVKVTLPLWQNRVLSSVQEARRNLNASQARFENAQNMSGYEVKDAYFKFTTSKQIVELYENALIPETELAFHSDQAGYEAGKVDILNFLDSERIYLNTKIAYYQARVDALNNFAALERAVGVTLVRQGGQQ